MRAKQRIAISKRRIFEDRAAMDAVNGERGSVTKR